MKVKDLLEAPVNLGKDLPAHMSMKNMMSRRALERDYQHLGTLTKTDTDPADPHTVYDYWFSAPAEQAHVTVKGIDEIGEERELIVTTVHFEKRAYLPVKNELQVSYVSTNVHYRNKFLAASLYILLARYGHTIVSDTVQYNGGVELWKKLARQATAREYVVRIWNTTTGDWIKDAGDEPVRYDASNLDDSVIWKDISTLEKDAPLLVLTSK